MNTLLRLFGLPLILLAVVSCKKYDEGPLVSLRSKKERVANTWKLDELRRNGAIETLSNAETTYRLTLNEEGNAAFTSAGIFGSNTTGTWSFEADKEYLTLAFTGITGSHELDGRSKILRLKEEELWLEHVDSGGDIWEYHWEED